MITCKICHKTFKSITQTHLYYKHLIEPDEYMKEFKVRTLISPETRQLHSIASTGNTFNVGRKRTKEHKDMVRRTFTKLWKSKAFREKMTNIKKAIWRDDNLRRRHGEAIKARWKDPSYREKMSKINSISALKLWKRPEFRKKRAKLSRELWKDPDYRNRNISARPRKYKKRHE